MKKFWHFFPHYTNSQNSIIFFGYVDSEAKIVPPIENSTTNTTKAYRVSGLAFIFVNLARIEQVKLVFDYKENVLHTINFFCILF